MICCDGEGAEKLLSMGVLVGNYRISVDNVSQTYVMQNRVMYVECIEENWYVVVPWIESFIPIKDKVIVNIEEVHGSVTENMLYEAGIKRMKLGKIPMIKILRYTTNTFSLVEAKHAVEDFQSSFGVDTIENMEDFWRFIKYINQITYE